jgi:hypothetical protein
MLEENTDTDSQQMPSGTTAQRGADGAGKFRYNSETAEFEGFTTEWGAIGGGLDSSYFAPTPTLTSTVNNTITVGNYSSYISPVVATRVGSTVLEHVNTAGTIVVTGTESFNGSQTVSVDVGDLGMLQSIGNAITVNLVYIAGTDISSSFMSFGEYLVTDNAGDTSSSYSVSEIQVSHDGDARLYIAHKTTASTTWKSDAPIAAIQILDSDGTTVLHQYYFGGETNQGWETTPDGYAAGATGISTTPTEAASLSYSSITANATADTFGIAGQTGSATTGAANGIASPTGPMVLGEATTAQVPFTFFVYREASGSVLDQATYMRSPVISWTNGSRVRVAYIIGNDSSIPQETDDTLFMGIA